MTNTPVVSADQVAAVPGTLSPSGPCDIFDKPIFVGDLIVYATRRGSGTYLNKLLVTGVTNSRITGKPPGETGPHVATRVLKNFGTIAKVA